MHNECSARKLPYVFDQVSSPSLNHQPKLISLVLSAVAQDVELVLKQGGWKFLALAPSTLKFLKVWDMTLKK